MSSRVPALLLVISLTAGVAAAWLVDRETAAAARRGGPPVAVLATLAPIERGRRIAEDDAASLFVRRAVPGDYAPPDAIGELSMLVGSIAAADLPAGAFATSSLFAGPGPSSPFRLRRSERAVTVDARIAPDDGALAAGRRVDLFASGNGGDDRTELLLSGAEVLAAGDSPGRGVARATLRVAAGQVAAVVRGDVFARELRAVLLP